MAEPLTSAAVAAKGEEVVSLAGRLAEAAKEFGRMTAFSALTEAMKEAPPAVDAATGARGNGEQGPPSTRS